MVACLIRKYKKGRKKLASPYWYVRYAVEGRVIDCCTDTRNMNAAKRIRNKIEDELALGRWDLIPVSNSLTVEEWYKEFFDSKEVDLAAGSVDRYRRSIDRFLEFCASVKLMRQFTAQHIEKFKNERSKEVGKNAVCNELTAIRVFFNSCEKKHKIRSPTKDITIGGADKKPPCLYSQDEMRKMLLAKNTRDRAMFLLALQAGLRKGEMGSRKWKHIDFERGNIWVRKEDGFIPKDKTDRWIPLKPETKEALLEWRKISKHNKGEDFIFPNREGKEFIATKPFPRSNFDRPMKEALEKAGLIGGNCKKFRDSFASYSLGVGVPPQNVQQWYGHSDFKTTQHYLNYLPQAIEPDIRKLFEWRG